MTEGISRAIGELAAAQRLSATSVMVTSPHWPATAPRLPCTAAISASDCT